MLADGVVCKQLTVTPACMGSCPLAIGPTLGARFGLSGFTTPFRRSGLCTRLMAVDKQLNKSALDKIGW